MRNTINHRIPKEAAIRGNKSPKSPNPSEFWIRVRPNLEMESMIKACRLLKEPENMEGIEESKSQSLLEIFFCWRHRLRRCKSSRNLSDIPWCVSRMSVTWMAGAIDAGRWIDSGTSTPWCVPLIVTLWPRHRIAWDRVVGIKHWVCSCHGFHNGADGQVDHHSHSHSCNCEPNIVTVIYISLQSMDLSLVVSPLRMGIDRPNMVITLEFVTPPSFTWANTMGAKRSSVQAPKGTKKAAPFMWYTLYMLNKKDHYKFYNILQFWSWCHKKNQTDLHWHTWEMEMPAWWVH